MLVSFFAVWWFNPVHVPNNFEGILRIADVLLFLLVSFVIWHPIVMQILTWTIASHIKDVSANKPIPGLKVAFITTFVPASESIELLHKCLPAMINAKYEHDTWLLDEGNDPRVKKICEQYGVKHFSRHGKDHYNTESGKYKRGTKGGNHNSWYDSHGHEYDIVAQIDTDFVPDSSFLIKTLGYFRNPKVAFVGTPQIYGNTKDSIIARGAAEQTYNFYGPILRGFHGMGMNTLIGANHVIRVKALEDIDHYSAHITEDLLTGMKLHANGWESVYVNEVLAVGEGPTTWQAYFSQQMRWAYGCMHILLHHSPKLFREMSFRQAAYYFFLQQHYFSGLAMAAGTMGLAIYFGLGLNTADISLAPFLSIYLPVIAMCGLMALWLQRFNIRPKHEKGPLWAGKIISIASWPIFLIAFLGVITGKKLTYKVTPKGESKVANEDSLRLFAPHIAIGLVSLVGLLSTLFTGRTSLIMIFWALCSAALMLFVPFSQQVVLSSLSAYDKLASVAQAVNYRYKLFEFRAPDKQLVPNAPTDEEKHLYIERHHRFIILFSVISFTSVTFSMFRFLAGNPALWWLFSFLLLTVVYFLVSFTVNIFTKNFDFRKHQELVDDWQPKIYPSVDIFLPTAGEDMNVLANTWDGVLEMSKHYKGHVEVYCLDDSARNELKNLALQYSFKYEVRPDRGEFKKAGNLRHGYKVSDGEFIVIFDADFKPRLDFLDELLPYMEHNPKVGIVQSPQYFDVHTEQNWLERGAGAVQELFYRFSQVSRQSHDAAICVGSNAIYRRTALKDTGGTALIEHSEDVHTGFNLRMHGWTVQYVPVLLAKGLCPSTMPAFFKQQYRWCMGSMSLLSSSKFWDTKLAPRTRLSYMSGFLYYIHTALSSFYTPIIPLVLLIALPDAVKLQYTLFVLPAFLFAQFIYPLWHKSIYGIEAWAVRSIYGWAHLFAIYDALTHKAMQWQPTGAVKGRDYRYITFRVFQIIFNFIPAVLWVGYAMWNMHVTDLFAFAPMLVSGMFYLAICSKVAFYTTKPVYLNKSKQRTLVTFATEQA